MDEEVVEGKDKVVFVIGINKLVIINSYSYTNTNLYLFFCFLYISFFF